MLSYPLFGRQKNKFLTEQIVYLPLVAKVANLKIVSRKIEFGEIVQGFKGQRFFEYIRLTHNIELLTLNILI